MIISHRWRFIFIKTHKTAGSSIETLLSSLCGDDDVITPMDPPASGHEPRNWIGSSPLDRWYARSARARKLINRDSRFLGRHYYQHMSASRVRQICGPEIWDAYFKFCFERNPWDKVVSFYWWKMRGKAEHMPFSEWLRSKGLPVDSQLYCLEDTPGVDFIGRFENLEQHLKEVFTHLGMGSPEALPRIKTGIRQGADGYEPLYDDDDREFVAARFATEIELFDYRFGKDSGDKPWRRKHRA